MLDLKILTGWGKSNGTGKSVLKSSVKAMLTEELQCEVEDLIDNPGAIIVRGLNGLLKQTLEVAEGSTALADLKRADGAR